MTPTQLSKEGLETVSLFVKLLNQKESSIEINKFYLQDLRRILTKENYKWRIHNEYKTIVNPVFKDWRRKTVLFL